MSSKFHKERAQNDLFLRNLPRNIMNNALSGLAVVRETETWS